MPIDLNDPCTADRLDFFVFTTEQTGDYGEQYVMYLAKCNHCGTDLNPAVTREARRHSIQAHRKDCPK